MVKPEHTEEQYRSILRQYWGYNDFRSLQLDIIMSVGRGKDTLGLMPTGGGKSLTFQVPALAQEGVCLVVTPLIALMKDQVEQLKRLNIGAAAIYTGIRHNQILQILENCEYGAYKFLYVSPERLNSELFLKRLPFLNISMIAVDEAHCISQWGYDFRPSYLKIADLRTLLPDVPVLALTATATSEVVDDIQERLAFKENNAFRKSYYRDNLVYVVRETENKMGQLLQILNNVPGSSVVYVRSRLKTQEINDLLKQNGISSTYYHAGLTNEVKDSRQLAWKKGECRVMVATNAFGMGIDKPDVRSVVHMDLPDTIEAYFQEAGRGGRDGKRSYAVLLYNNSDSAKLKKRISDNFPTKEMIKEVYQSLADFYVVGEGSGQGCVFPFEINKFSVLYHYPILQTFSAIKILELSGYLELTEEQENPSKLQIIAKREELYRIDIKEKRLDNLLELLLRHYTGILNDRVHINENYLAEKLDTTRDNIYKQLSQLDLMHIVKYVPFKKVPLLIYTRQRYADKDVFITKLAYEDRKERFERRIHGMLDYANENSICRSRQLLYYFGEVKSEDCGMCDVCLAKRKSNGIIEDKELNKKLIAFLKKQPATIEDVCMQFKMKQDQMLPILRLLVSDELLVYDVDDNTFKAN